MSKISDRDEKDWKNFLSNNEKLIFYNLYSALRDEKFPKFKNSSFQIDSSSLYPCSIKNGEVTLFITNGPEIPIAKKEFKNNFIDFDSIVYLEFEGIEISKTTIFGLPLRRYENS